MTTNSQRLVIEGNIVRHEEVRTLSEAPLASLRSHLITRLPALFPVLPRNTKLIGYDPQRRRGVIMVEMLPMRTHLNLSGGSRSGGYNIQLPYQYFVYTFTMSMNVDAEGQEHFVNFGIVSSMLMWRPSTLRSEKDDLWYAAIPNVDQGGGICWGSTSADTSSLSARIDELTNSFAITQFNGDLGLRTPDYGSSYAQWEKASEDPLVYMKWTFWDRAKAARNVITAKALFDRLMGTTNPKEMTIADFDQSFVELPTPPVNFTIARATEWLNSLSDAQKLRIIGAVNLAKKPKGKDTPLPNPDDPIAEGAQQALEAIASADAMADPPMAAL